MIILYPTGFYKPILPTKPSDGGNVTYTISNNTPPKTNLLFPKIPKGVVDRKRPDKNFTTIIRRETQGELIYSVNSSNRSLEGNNSKVFEVGQIFEFGDSSSTKIDTMFVSNKSETRHDINRFDYEKLGLTDDDINTINEKSLFVQIDLMNKLNQAVQLRANAEVEIATQQKIINDSTRNISALQIVLDDSGGTDPMIQNIYDKFVVVKNNAVVLRDKAISDANAYAADASKLKSKLLTIATVIK